MTRIPEPSSIIGLIGMGEMGRMYANRLAQDPSQRSVFLLCFCFRSDPAA